jgi:hypothetical protein
MNNKIMKFGYEDTDKKIEVELYGLIFEINKEKILDKNTDILNSDNENAIRDEIKEIIGEDSIDKINKKRKEDGYNEMTLDVEIAVLTCLFKAYMTASADTLVDEINETTNKYKNDGYIQRNGKPNRYERRNRYYRR